jgi:16S rRNA (guanine966-N2)-methyltransferase
VVVRVVAGSLGGRRLATPPGRATRPTSELVRAAIFNSLDAVGLLEGAVVADLFAGSGALGIEALSRGAAHATFVEEDRRAAAIIDRNLDTLVLAAHATLIVSPVERWKPPATLDVVLADPPYGWVGWNELLTRLATFPDVLVIAESDRDITADGWRVLAVKRHGGTVVTQLRPREAT